MSPSPSHIALRRSPYHTHPPRRPACSSLIDDGTHAFLSAKGIAVINASPLSMGLLTARGPPVWHPAKPELKARCADAAAYCAARGVDISTLALSFCLEAPGVATTLISTASVRGGH